MEDKWKQKYTKEQLFDFTPKKPFEDQYLSQISFPLGGIGAGSIGLNGRGNLCDFEIFNRPNVGSRVNRTFPLIRCSSTKDKQNEPIARVLEGPMLRPYTPLDGGRYHANAEGFPHMDSVKFTGEYPFALLNFECAKMPLEVKLEAYNPYIPSDADSSSIPISILKYHVKNTSAAPVDVSILWSMINMVGYRPQDFHDLRVYGALTKNHGLFTNTFVEEEGLSGISFFNRSNEENDPFFGDIVLSTPDKNVSHMKYWKQTKWFDQHYHIWESFKETGNAVELHETPVNRSEAAALSIMKTIIPGEEEIFTFYITWYFPNTYKYWTGWIKGFEYEGKPFWKNYYSTLYEDAWDVALKFKEKEQELYDKTKKFHDAIYSSTLPNYVIDAITSNMALIKTSTCLRLEDGSLYGWEGCHADSGCCQGSCLHVWGYEQTVPFLFPSLKRSLLENALKYNFMLDDVDLLEFRMYLPRGKGHIGTPGLNFCADGQLGQIIHAYREWKLMGDNEWIKNLWPSLKRALEFTWEDWDEKKQGYLIGPEHNTYDIEFWGPNAMHSSYYIAALLCGSEIAKYLGENNSAEEYKSIALNGAKWIDDNLFNKDFGFYIQQIRTPPDEKEIPLNQVKDGCLIDQVLGQQLGKIAGIPNFFKTENIKSALKSIFKYNWMPNMRDHENGARLYCVNDEAGVLIATWPFGGRPKVPFPYADEVMNGFEYQFGTHCIMEGLIEEGLAVCKSIRNRYDGWGRNPWDEFECGHHYARSMAAYGYLIALSGFIYDKGNGVIGFDPKISQDDFKCFWSLNGVWGNYIQRPGIVKIEILYGSIELQSIILPQIPCSVAKIITSNQEQSIEIIEGGIINLPEKQKLEESETLEIRY